MRKGDKKLGISYEPEADVLRVEAAKGKIEYAIEAGNVVVHVSPEGTPVYVEILEASKFLKRASMLLPSKRAFTAPR